MWSKLEGCHQRAWKSLKPDLRGVVEQVDHGRRCTRRLEQRPLQRSRSTDLSGIDGTVVGQSSSSTTSVSVSDLICSLEKAGVRMSGRSRPPSGRPEPAPCSSPSATRVQQLVFVLEWWSVPDRCSGTRRWSNQSRTSRRSTRALAARSPGSATVIGDQLGIGAVEVGFGGAASSRTVLLRCRNLR